MSVPPISIFLMDQERLRNFIIWAITTALASDSAQRKYLRAKTDPDDYCFTYPIHCSANLPDSLRQASSSNSVLEISVDASYQAKCRDAVTEACSYF
ncbi:unnamed protein product [Vicia faba]|uniref:Uncharacterized protein n=1 Tax=Vicia faba TaxID=3906 RepID=A0AAV0ZRP1_VICFA|nr:unnamed protein product [Vicia faba]